jgi:hypothetical protein
MIRATLAVAASVVVGALAAAPAAHAELLFSSTRCDDGAKTCPAIWRAADDGSGARRLAAGGASASWDLLGRRIFFHRGQQELGGAARIWSMAPDGGDQRPMTPPGDGFFNELNPAVSADGSLVAFDSTRGENGGQMQVWVMASDGSGLRRVTDEGGASRLPRFSPDGRRVIYLHYAGGLPGGTASVRTRLLAGGPPLEVIDASNRVGPFALSFSLDGTSIALTMRFALYTIDAGGTRPTLRAPSAGEVTWALDRTLFFSGPNGRGQASIYRLAPDAAPESATLVVEDAHNPSWSALALELPPLPTIDDLPPLMALPISGGVPSLVAADPSGLRTVEAAFARRTGGRCRAVRGRRLGARRSCERPPAFRPVTARTFDRSVRRLPRGRYRAWLRARDGEGNATQSPLAANFRR